jgi:L-2-hydroxyglutarate oxidase LhgO
MGGIQVLGASKTRKELSRTMSERLEENQSMASTTAHPLYYGMEYSENKKQIAEWIPLVMEGRDPNSGFDLPAGIRTKNHITEINTNLS